MHLDIIKFFYLPTDAQPHQYILIILTTITLASSNNALPDDGDCTETCRSCFNVTFNILFKAILLCISW